MKSIIINLILKFVTPEMISNLLAKLICRLLQNATETKNWEHAKDIADAARNWLNLFNECYEDEIIDESDEAKIAEAISQMTSITKISEIIRK